MNKNEILEKIRELNKIIKNANLNFYLKNHYKELYDQINEMTSFLNKFKKTTSCGKILDISIFERIYCIEHDLTDRPKCKVCCKEYVRFIVHENRYCDWCSISCSQKDPNTQQKLKQTRKIKYGDENFNNNRQAKQTRLKNNNGQYHADDFNQKIKTTKFKHFGDENYVNVEKARKTRYKNNNGKWNNDQVMQQIYKTKELRYGDKFYNNRKKFKETLNTFTNEDWKKISEKRIKSNNLIYGCDYPNQNLNVQKKTQQTNLQKYNVKNTFQLEYAKSNAINFFKKLAYKNFENNYDFPAFTEEQYLNTWKTLDKFEFICKKCGNKYESEINGSLHCKCPICYPKISGISNEEKEIRDFVKSLNFNIVENCKNIISPYELDLYIPERKVAIEFDGLYWHSDINKTDKKYHLNKTKMCEKLEIQLIHVFENEWKFQTDIVKSNLKNILTENNNLIGSFEIKEIDFDKAAIFLETNHIQGIINSSINIGLYQNNEIISLMSLNKNAANNQYELLRFCNKLFFNSDEPFKLLLNYFETKYSPEKLVAILNRRWSNGFQLRQNNFKLIKETEPDYWYWKNLKMHHHVKFQKHKLKNLLKNFDPDKSEIENMTANGYQRIFDCGNLVFIKEYN